MINHNRSRRSQTADPISFVRCADGSWNLSGHASDLREGSFVTVARRDGRTSSVRVGAIVTRDGSSVTTLIA